MSLDFKTLKKRNILSESQMRCVHGGTYGTCGYISVINGISTVKCHVTLGEVNFAKSSYMASVAKSYEGCGENEFRWCCDSCIHTEYCGLPDNM